MVKAFVFAICMAICGSVAVIAAPTEVPYKKFQLLNLPASQDPELVGVQVPIAKEDRKFNKSGVQCVWCSLETLGRHNGVPNTYDLTDKYKQATHPGYVAEVLNERGITFKQINAGRFASTRFIREYVVKKKYGVAVGLQGTHMVTLVHYDDDKNIVKVIDNGGPDALKIQTWTMEKFNQRFDGWALAIFPLDAKVGKSELNWKITFDPTKLYGEK